MPAISRDITMLARRVQIGMRAPRHFDSASFKPTRKPTFSCLFAISKCESSLPQQGNFFEN
jgi:hypothetical protein